MSGRVDRRDVGSVSAAMLEAAIDKDLIAHLDFDLEPPTCQIEDCAAGRPRATWRAIALCGEVDLACGHCHENWEAWVGHIITSRATGRPCVCGLVCDPCGYIGPPQDHIRWEPINA